MDPQRRDGQMTTKTFFEKFEQFADAPNPVAKIREFVLELAMQGRLTPRNCKDEPDPCSRANTTPRGPIPFERGDL